MANPASRRRSARPQLLWPKPELPPWGEWLAAATLGVTATTALVSPTVELTQWLAGIGLVSALPLGARWVIWSGRVLYVVIQRARWY